jgi:hypothetical protein
MTLLIAWFLFLILSGTLVVAFRKAKRNIGDGVVMKKREVGDNKEQKILDNLGTFWLQSRISVLA